MFGMLFGFLALVAFSSLVVGGLLVGRKFAQLLHVRGDTEVLKAQIRRQDLKHQLSVSSHQHNLQLLALTAPQEEEPAEEVSFKSKHITEPPTPLTDKWEHETMQRTADDVEVTPLPFTAS